MDIDLRTRYGRLQAQVPDPQGTMRWPEFVFNLFPLEERLVAMGVRAAQQEGRAVSCRAGCGACCRQPVPVSAPEAFLLWEMLAGVLPEKRQAYLERFEAAQDALRAEGFADRTLEGEAAAGKELVRMAVDYFKLQIPCPFLEEESCSIHPFRPLICREHLVTSPADLCRHLIHPEIRMIRPSVSLTQVLVQMYSTWEGEPATLLPLPLALDFAQSHRELREKRHDAAKLFSDFLDLAASLMYAPDDT